MNSQAIQFDGTAKCAHDIMELLGCGVGDFLIIPKPLSHIEIGYDGGTFRLYPNWWVLRREDGAVNVLEELPNVE